MGFLPIGADPFAPESLRVRALSSGMSLPLASSSATRRAAGRQSTCRRFSRRARPATRCRREVARRDGAATRARHRGDLRHRQSGEGDPRRARSAAGPRCSTRVQRAVAALLSLPGHGRGQRARGPRGDSVGAAAIGLSQLHNALVRCRGAGRAISLPPAAGCGEAVADRDRRRSMTACSARSIATRRGAAAGRDRQESVTGHEAGFAGFLGAEYAQALGWTGVESRRVSAGPAERLGRAQGRAAAAGGCCSSAIPTPCMCEGWREHWAGTEREDPFGGGDRRRRGLGPGRRRPQGRHRRARSRRSRCSTGPASSLPATSSSPSSATRRAASRAPGSVPG